MPSATRPCCPVEGKLAAWPEGQVSRRPHTAPKVGEFDLESKDQKWCSSGQVARKGTLRLKLQTHLLNIFWTTHFIFYFFSNTVHMLAADSSLALRIFIVMLLSLGCCCHKATSYCRNLWTYIQLASYSTGSCIGTRPAQRCICCSSYDKWWLHGWCIGCARYHLHLPAEWTIWNWNQIPCPSLRWNLKMTVSNRNLLFEVYSKEI